MAHWNAVVKTRKVHKGACHRCGWSGTTSAISAGDRKELGVGRTVRHLCDECIDDLLHEVTAEAKPVVNRSAA